MVLSNSRDKVAGKTLIIAEKLSVACDIAKALGGFSKGNGHYERSDAIVANARGHLVEIFSTEADTGGRTLSSLPVIPARFDLRPTPDTGPQLRHLLLLMKDPSVTSVVNACDAGREGELIFRLIYAYAGCRKPIKRLWLQSMTDESIRQAWQNMRPGEDYQSLADSAYCRSEADWIIGINGTRGVTRLYERQNGSYELMNVGRVQTPTLSLVVNREREITDFIVKPFWQVRANFGVAAGTYVGTWFDVSNKSNPADVAVDSDSNDAAEGDGDAGAGGQRLFDKSQAELLVAKCTGVAPSSVSEESKLFSELPPRLFDLTGLQREANKLFKFSAKKTLDIAQALYETHKVTTYPRTDAEALPEDYVVKARELMGTFAGTAYAGLAQAVIDGSWVKQNKRIFDNSKITDHFAIIPTSTKPASLKEDEQIIYDLIVRRFVAAFYPSSAHQITTRITVINNESFRVIGRVLLEPGWTVVYESERPKKAISQVLCAYDDGELVRNQGVAATVGKTQSPDRYTEGTLLGAMKSAGRSVSDHDLHNAVTDAGLGTSATRASIIEGLLSTGNADKPKQPYLIREAGQYLVPTTKADGLYEFLTRNSLSALTSALMTVEWETKLLDVQKGRLERREFMDEICKSAHSMIDVLKSKSLLITDASQHAFPTPCPKCGGELSGNRKLECSCGFGVWKTISDRPLSPDELKLLLTKRRTGVLKGFFSSKTNRKFDAILVVKDDFTIGFEFPESITNSNVSGSVLKILAAPCPKCKGEVRIITGDRPRYVCASGDFTLWGTIAGRTLSDREATTLVRTRSLAPVNGFVSAAKKKFAAGLRLSADCSKVEFYFDNK